LAQDEEFLRALVRTALQEVLEAEMTEALGAEKGERAAGRQGYRSGYYGRTLITRVGKLELRVPQDRAGRFSTELFERYQRSERALVAALAEMYVQGVSTRKVKAITEELCGHSFSASSISAMNQRLDASLAQFAGRPLAEAFPYLIKDKQRYLRHLRSNTVASIPTNPHRPFSAAELKRRDQLFTFSRRRARRQSRPRSPNSRVPRPRQGQDRHRPIMDLCPRRSAARAGSALRSRPRPDRPGSTG
jgi:Transposase, Mutator family